MEVLPTLLTEKMLIAHLAEAYVESHHHDTEGRVRDALTEVGVSIISGAISTLGATMFMFFCYVGHLDLACLALFFISLRCLPYIFRSLFSGTSAFSSL